MQSNAGMPQDGTYLLSIFVFASIAVTGILQLQAQFTFIYRNICFVITYHFYMNIFLIKK